MCQALFDSLLFSTASQNAAPTLIARELCEARCLHHIAYGDRSSCRQAIASAARGASPRERYTIKLSVR
jgi:hypothetical protein